MEMSCILNPTHAPIFSTRRSSFQKTAKFNLISCRANTLEIQRVSTNFYEVLSLESQDVGFEDIKKAYRTMARRYHPDVAPPSRKEESTQKFVELQQAYETLSNPISRQKYDFELGYLSRCGMNGMHSEEWNTDFYKHVWKDQLSGLEFKSNGKRFRKNKAACM